MLILNDRKSEKLTALILYCQKLFIYFKYKVSTASQDFIGLLVGWLVDGEFYIQATSKAISGQVPG